MGNSNASIGLNWFKKLRLLDKRRLRIIIIGLENSGKTTIIQKLKFGEIKTAIPTLGYHKEIFKWKNIKITAWDIDGSKKSM